MELNSLSEANDKNTHVEDNSNDVNDNNDDPLTPGGVECQLSQELNVDKAAGQRRIKVKISRPAYTQERFDRSHRTQARHRKNIKERFHYFCARLKCSRSCAKHAILRCLPFIKIMSKYSVKKDMVGDLVAGLTIGVMHIPQGMAYGLLTGLPAVYGLYVSFFPVIIYFFLGTSKHISIGTFAVISLMVANAVERFDCTSSGASEDVTDMPPLNSTAEYILYTATSTTVENITESHVHGSRHVNEVICKLGIATAVTFLAGLIQFVMGLLRLGFVTIYLSDPLTRGLTTGAAIHVATSQIKHVFGIPVHGYQGALKLVYTYIDFFSSITQTNIAALVMSSICILIMALIKEFVNPKVKKVIKMPVPIELIVVVLGTITSYFWKMEDRFNIDVVGEIPTGIPPPTFPPVYRFSSVLVDAVALALVAFAINISLVKLFAKKHAYETDSNQELMAYGITNCTGSMFNCYMSAASLSRSLVQEGVGGRTQVAGLVSSSLLLIVLFAIGPLFEQLPKCVLAAIILVNLKGMFLQFDDLKKLWIVSLYDFLTWIVVFMAVVLLDVDMGLAVGLGFCLLTVVFRTQSPYTCLLGRVPSTDIYKDVDVYPGACELPGVKVFRFEASLYFANAEYFVQKLFARAGVNPRKLRSQLAKMEKDHRTSSPKDSVQTTNLRKRKATSLPEIEEGEILHMVKPHITNIIIDCTTMGYVDYVGVATLNQVIEEYKLVGICVSLAGCKAGIREMLECAGFFDHIPRDQLFVSVHDAVLVALENNPSLLEQLKNDSQMALHADSYASISPTSSRPHTNPLLQTEERCKT